MAALLLTLVALMLAQVVDILPEPLCEPPAGATAEWRAAHDLGGPSDAASYTNWIDQYPGYGAANKALEGLASDDVLGHFTDFSDQVLVVVIDAAAPEGRRDAIRDEIVAGHPPDAPPVLMVESCVPLSRTRAALDDLVAGVQRAVGEAASDTDWSVVAWPSRGGLVELWLADMSEQLADRLSELILPHRDLVFVVVGDDFVDAGLSVASDSIPVEPPGEPDPEARDGEGSADREAPPGAANVPEQQNDNVSGRVGLVATLVVIAATIVGSAVYWARDRRHRSPS